MRKHRLLKDPRGSAAVESIFALVVMMILVLGVVQVGLTLYARNVVLASAHEGARAAVERGRDLEDARAIVKEVVAASVGGAVSIIDLNTATFLRDGELIVDVSVRAQIAGLGPLPVKIPVLARASAGRPAIP